MRKLLCPFMPAASKEASNSGLSGVDVVLEDDVVDLKGVAVVGDPIVGTEVVALDERGRVPSPPPLFHHRRSQRRRHANGTI